VLTYPSLLWCFWKQFTLTVNTGHLGEPFSDIKHFHVHIKGVCQFPHRILFFCKQPVCILSRTLYTMEWSSPLPIMLGRAPGEWWNKPD
jgi:hypothetical protein